MSSLATKNGCIMNLHIIQTRPTIFSYMNNHPLLISTYGYTSTHLCTWAYALITFIYIYFQWKKKVERATHTQFNKHYINTKCKVLIKTIHTFMCGTDTVALLSNWSITVAFLPCLAFPRICWHSKYLFNIILFPFWQCRKTCHW